MPARILRADPDDTGDTALAHRALVPAEGPDGPEQHFSVRHGQRRAMLDHLLVSRGLAPYCRRAVVHNVDFADETAPGARSEEHTYEFQSLMRSSYAVFCLKKITRHFSIP